MDETQTIDQGPNRTVLLDTMKDEKYVVEFCEGNPGCATVIGRLTQYIFTEGHPYTAVKPLLVQLVDMNIRGSQVWCLYKDVFGGDLRAMVDAISKRDEAMLEALNSISYHPRPDLKLIPYHQKAISGGWKPQ